MKLHIVTVGTPHLDYAKQGWNEYFKRLNRFHQMRVTHISDKKAYDAAHILQAAGNAYKIALVIVGQEFTSPELATWLEKRSHEGKELCFFIGGPEGLPVAVIEQADLRWSLSKLTFPHDLAMVATLEALYRASTIAAGHPYHKA